jgi:hypothetical protein
MNTKYFQLPKSPEEPVKGFSLGRCIEAARKKAAELTGVAGWKLEGDYYRKFCAALSSVEELETDPEVVEMSLKEFYGGPSTQDIVKRMILRLEACKDILDSNMVIPEWTGEPDIWSYAIVKDVEIVKVKNLPRPIANLDCEFYSNIIAGRTYRLAFPPGYLKKILHDTGYPAYVPAHPREIMNFHFNVMLGRTGYGRVGAIMIKASSAQMKRNRKLVRDRYNRKCNELVACCECNMGLDKCPELACRKTTKVEDSSNDNETKTPNDVRIQRPDVQSCEGHNTDHVSDSQGGFNGGLTGQTGSC